MNRVIYKYPLEITDSQIVQTQQGAQILTVQMQGPKLCMWALGEVGDKKQNRYIHIFGTGNPIIGNGLRYIGTVQQGSLVWHVFERE